ncbi:uncharacterized protein Z519_09322 [Cladophialophora bantiana CBS 173.52]|uniref:Phosphate transporter n=1 Tax=Cladophialophora bantiana (strain ATCC 10958 / CBS 173.52 / CDC B-1940 / NIH 8579) TaxID=1442370 RepID=A0A0D2H9F2_CLAB1|nr:uncharacterized protein Z519_09322 [Cladophialophora bantiana CBS 173.52]KIW89893.1 hypothetical protein Z519_09322 [Cladophialophora bantiana CBS 173.52]
MILHAYDYIFALGVMFAFFDAWNIGANDVANSFATSVSSRSLTMRQAVAIATVMELAGAIGAGARVAETIRTKIIDPNLFKQDPAVLMLGMVCALVGSSTYVFMATKLGLPVSTTHSIMGGVIGMGFATVGASEINWGWNGVATVFTAWGTAPGIAAAFGATVFLITKYGVMLRKNPVRNAFFSIPAYFVVTGSLIAMLIIWKGASSRLNSLSDGEIIGCIIGTGFGVGLLVIIFFLPYLWVKVVRDDWQINWRYIPLGPLLLRRSRDIPPKPENITSIQNYYRGHLTRQELDCRNHQQDVEANTNQGHENPNEHKGSPRPLESPSHTIVGPRPDGKWYTHSVLWWALKKAFWHGIDQDVIDAQKKRNILSGDVEEMHARAAHYDNKAEYMYSFLQVMTASAASFTHGANDVSNAVGPFATIYYIWRNGNIDKSSPVPTWILAFGGLSIVLGLYMYGYNIMRNLGNRITLHSPSRGFSMELGAAITVIIATRLKIPISTTQCISGATVAVGLCNGNWRSVNWRMVAWIYAGWIFTLPITALVSGCLMAIIINAPQYGHSVHA